MSVKFLPLSHGSKEYGNRSAQLGRRTDADRLAVGRGSSRSHPSVEVPQGPDALACEARRDFGERVSVSARARWEVFGASGRSGLARAGGRRGGPPAVSHRKNRVEQPHNLRATPARARCHNRPQRARKGAR